MYYSIEGKHFCEGEVIMSGSKNAALPILAASILVEDVVLENIPDISDVRDFLKIIQSLGSKVTFENNTVHLENKNLSLENLDKSAMGKMRASALLIAPLLNTFGKIEIPFPGGCTLGKRWLDEHIKNFEQMGFSGKATNNSGVQLSGDLSKEDILLCPYFSVTATENMITGNVLRDGKTTVTLSAFEPHIFNLVDFLRAIWADISVRYDHKIIIQGVKQLKKQIHFRVTSDYLETGTFMLIGALMAKDSLLIKNSTPDQLDSFLEKFSQTGGRYDVVDATTIRVYKNEKIQPIKFQTNIFPGFPTDLQAQFTTYLTQAEGMSRVQEIMFDGRFNYLLEIENMGGHVALLNPHEAIIWGKMNLKWSEVKSWDIRAGSAMVIAWLVAEGQTTVYDVRYTERGYENFVGKLQWIGFSIEQHNIS